VFFDILSGSKKIIPYLYSFARADINLDGRCPSIPSRLAKEADYEEEWIITISSKHLFIPHAIFSNLTD